MTAALHVAHVIALADCPGQAAFSGAEHHLFTLVKAQRDAGLRVSLVMLCLVWGPRLEAKREALEMAGVEVVVLRGDELRWRRPLGTASMFVGLARRLSRWLRQHRPDLVHTHLEHADVIGKWAAWRAGAPVVTSVHNNEPFHARPQWRILLRVLDRVTVHYIAISEAVAKHMESVMGVGAARYTVIPYGLPMPGAMRARVSIREELKLPADACVVGFVGRLAPQKNVGRLINAVGQVKGVELAVVGSGPLEPVLRDRAAARAPGRVHFVGQRDEAAELMPGFDLLCLPSTWEGLGLVLVEAMLRGTPTAGSRAGAIPEVLGEGRWGRLFAADAPGELESILEELRDDPQRLIEQAVEAREHAASYHTVERMLRQHLEVYEKVAGRPVG